MNLITFLKKIAALLDTVRKMIESGYPKSDDLRYYSLIRGLFLTALGFFFALQLFPRYETLKIRSHMESASRRMQEYSHVLRQRRLELGLPAWNSQDVNHTGLIGLEWSGMTTSMGLLEAKRTSSNPEFAALMVHLLSQAGVSRGDSVAVSASSSFPALYLAVIAALDTMECRPLVIFSLGASQWGANDPRFNLMEIHQSLYRAGLFHHSPLAVSLGGDQDLGEDLDPAVSDELMETVRLSGFRFLKEPDLQKNVELRMNLYYEAADSSAIKAFINIGGAHAGLGTDSSVLQVEPGLSRLTDLPSEKHRGVLFAMGGRGVPVIHLLFMRGLAERFGLPWDPAPLPEIGSGDVFRLPEKKSKSYFMIIMLYWIGVVATVGFNLKRGEQCDAGNSSSMPFI